MIRADKRIRPWTLYGCTCGKDLDGTSRREAHTAHRAHRRKVTR